MLFNEIVLLDIWKFNKNKILISKFILKNILDIRFLKSKPPMQNGPLLDNVCKLLGGIIVVSYSKTLRNLLLHVDSKCGHVSMSLLWHRLFALSSYICYTIYIGSFLTLKSYWSKGNKHKGLNISSLMASWV